MLAAIVPLAGWLRRNPRETPKIWMLMGFLPFGLGEFHLYMAAISWPQWPGYVKGLEISVLDVLALAMYLSLPRLGSMIPFRLSMALYFLAVVLAVFQTPVPIGALFYAWQLARVFLVYAVVAKACADERVAPALLTGMTIGLCFEACFAIWERFGLGILQAGGTLGHQNFLGLMSHFVTFPWLALLLAGERGWRPIAGPLAGLVIAALTVSRGTVGLMGAGYVGIFALSVLRRWTPRKAIILAVGVASVCVLAPVILSSFDQRFNEAEGAAGYESKYDERGAFENAAEKMISDHPMGVGSNYYVVAANTGGYNTRAAVTWAAGSETANVHNVYFLVAAETGYIGLITFVLMLLRPLVVAFRCGWRNRRDRRGDLLLGLGMSLFIVYIHSYFEWIFITFQAQYMFALDAGLVAGLATQLGYWHSKAGNRVAVDRAGAPITRAPATKVARN
jgi:O-antigen ligase